jgi:tRNA dimethylallyltransferase
MNRMSPSKNSHSPILIVSGPTGSGKSGIVHRLADEIPITIISADSRQIVKGFDIGSAKPTRLEREKYDYRLLDVIQPGETYSAFRFKEDTEREIKRAHRAGRIPVLCGGTGLYIRAVVEGIFEIPTPDAELRQKMADEAERLGAQGLHEKLRAIDPLEAEIAHANNTVRVQRALEIYYLTGKTKSELAESQRLTERPFEFVQMALTPPIADVYARIESRVDLMFEQGWLAEVEGLIEKWGSERILSARTIGYTEIAKHLEGLLSLPAAVELIKQSTRRFAKRQMTWLRGADSVEFFSDPAALNIRAVSVLDGSS